MPQAQVPLPPELSEFCRRHHIGRLWLFGSVLREDFGPDSDVDLLVEFEPEHIPGWEIVDIEEELSQLFGGRKVDLRSIPNFESAAERPCSGLRPTALRARPCKRMRNGRSFAATFPS